VTIQKRGRDKRWHHVTDDLGLQMIWSVDASGLYDARWEVPLSQAPGSYRFVVTAKKYKLASKPFAVSPDTSLTVADGKLAYPQPVVNVDITYRPKYASHARMVHGQLTDRWGNRAG